ncbi:MAG: helix-hairpin-helix domain-containing protein [Phycisphaerales bacterium]|nr:helix-hairpin-helix domain-containing protein [Phycisphaerales bacterium]
MSRSCLSQQKLFVSLLLGLSVVTTFAVPPLPSRSILAPDLRIDINQAKTAELELLPGIGAALAQRIVRWRQETGLYASVDDLDQIAGIGPVRIAELRLLVVASSSRR